MNIIYILKIGSSFTERHCNMLKHVSDERKAKINGYRYYKDKLGCLYSELLVRRFGSELINVSPDQLSFGCGANGKPFVLGVPDFHYNVTNTDGYVVLAVCEEPVGVDAERVRALRPKVMARCFTEREREYAKQGNDRFFEVWTKKEAYVKCKGKGLFSAPLNSFDVLDDKIGKGYTVLKTKELVVSAYTETEGISFTVKKIYENDILEYFE